MRPWMYFLSDMGEEDPDLALLKLRYQKAFPQIHCVHLSHQIQAYQLLQAAYYWRYLAKNFVKNSIHLLFVGHAQRYLMVNLYDQFLIAPDNGLLTLLSDNIDEKKVNFYEISLKNNELNFPALSLIPYLDQFLNQDFMNFNIAETIKTLTYPKIRFLEHVILGEIIYLDHYDNAVTNIHRQDFDFFEQKKWRISIKKLFFIEKITETYHQVVEGEVFAIFNQNGFLEIAFKGGWKKKYGGAGQLLGLKVGEKIRIELMV